ncbi:MAG: ABC transporter ATP-binding protein [Acidimicrobiia bacterium]|nr:ABC transporter ATP-binding protein [Acidimicrobiia bacterium]
MANGAQVLARSLVAVLSSAVLAVTAVVVQPAAAGAMIVAVLAVMLGMRPLNRRSRIAARRHGFLNRAVAESVTEGVSVAQEVRVFGVSDRLNRHLDRGIREALETQRQLVFLRLVSPQTYQSTAIILLGLGIGTIVVIAPSSVASLAVVVLLFVRASGYGQQVQRGIQQANEMIPYLQELRRHETRYRAAHIPTGGEPIPHIGALRFEDVHFTYDGGAPALEGISCEIAGGGMVGIVGPSGSGKSTFVQLVLRLREPTAGNLLVNGNLAESYSLGSWYQRVAMVPQSPQLFEATVADNIAFFREADRDEIERVARLARIHDEIVEMPDGYDTELAGVGGAVSGGQAQRLCIARALVGSPDLVVLDEPTSALDVRSEAAVQETLEEMHGTVTMIIIAHRLSTLRMCDRIMVLEEGRLEAYDVPERLLEQEGFYREAFELSQIS